MIQEVAELTIKPGLEGDFERGVEKAVPLFLRAKGCHGVSLHRVIETPQVYRLVVDWETVEDHMEGFRDSADFQTWREIVGPCFAAAPVVTHTRQVMSAR
ncbi:antibiotic biosynthesis monooxygenase family protein [Ensifer sp. SSB1]|jgi:quinol monooxygenase YgiN|uniref:antibiotic biosynthesis monooxygenase family protein n=1 Tax=Ensifer sp. SSB1 TaxID=2795385 RepID=UPI001A57B86C|nr:antibiotic biosynthesis monooxygenase family protein [Ensifer sp. SSB1]MBK5567994.1 antibiotic biosynthesis monooxygenase [Ensifer sp. SSB1]